MPVVMEIDPFRMQPVLCGCCYRQGATGNPGRRGEDIRECLQVCLRCSSSFVAWLFALD